MSRIAQRFAKLKSEGRAGFVPFLTAGDPDVETSLAMLKKLPESGADIIELGVPFSDPMADGPVIQAGSTRALKAGMSVAKILDMVKRFRTKDDETPLVLMGYFNPIHAFGVERFVLAARDAGVDGLITVDLGPEEDSTLRTHTKRAGIDIVRLAAPTTNEERLKRVLEGASGFLYYVSITGITGTKAADRKQVDAALCRIRRTTDLPCAVGFGIRTPDDAAAIAQAADAVVVGSALVSSIAQGLRNGNPKEAIIHDTMELCGTLSRAVRAARSPVTSTG